MVLQSENAEAFDMTTPMSMAAAVAAITSASQARAKHKILTGFKVDCSHIHQICTQRRSTQVQAHSDTAELVNNTES